MASSTSSAQIEYKMIVTPTENIQQEDSAGNLLLPQQESQQTQEEIQVSPTPIPTASNAASRSIQYNFFNVRVFGVVVGLVFLWIYIRGLKRK